jgi:Bacterial Ig-like domain
MTIRVMGKPRDDGLRRLLGYDMAIGSRLAVAVVALSGCSDAVPPLATAEPGVVFTYPADTQVDVPLGARVVVTFSDPVERGAVGPCTAAAGDVTGAFCLAGPDGPVDATAGVSEDGKTVQFASVAFAPGTTYRVYARSALAPTASNLPATGPLFSFTTRTEQARVAPPRLVAINGGPPTTPEAFRPMFESSTIRLVFSEPLDPRSVRLAPGAIELIDAAGAAVPATLLAQGIHAAIDPIADLTAGAAYQLKLGGKLVDLGGQAIAPTTITLMPRSTGAAHPIPELMRTRQASDAGPATSHAGADRNVIAIDKPLVGKELAQVLPSVVAAELGDPTALGGPLAFTLRRGQRLKASGLDVKLGGELAVGLQTGDVEIELLTDGGGRIYRNPHQPDDQRPENERSPLQVDLSMDLAVYAADPSGNAVLTQTVLGVQASGTVIATAGVLDIEAVIAMDLGLLGVARAPTNLVLELITDPTAERVADTTGPSLVASLPSTAGEAEVDTGIELIFTEPIDLDRARAGGLVLQTLNGDPVDSVIESHGSAVVIRPTRSLTYSTTYKVAMTDVADVAGNPLTGTAAMSFTTAQLVTTSVPLAVSSVHPGAPCPLTGASATSPGRCASGGGGDDSYHLFALAANEPIHVTFTQPPNPDSLTQGTACNAGSVRIEQVDAKGACVAAVPGTLIRHDRAISFLPEAPWQLGQRYRLTLVSGNDRTCSDGEICGITAQAASFDPLAGVTSGAAGGPNLSIDFTGASASDATLMITEATPFTDVNGSGFIEAGEQVRDDNRVALRILGTEGLISSASFDAADCVPETPEKEGCMYLSGAMPVGLLPLAHGCALPGGETAASCVPVVLSPQAMYATSVAMHATALFSIPATTGMSVLRIREPSDGPITGYLIDDQGTPTLVLQLQLYLDAPDMNIDVPLVTPSHDLHSKQLMPVTLRGPMRFLPDGRIAISVSNVADVPVDVTITLGASGTVHMVVPRGEMKLQLVSPPLRGGLQ